MKKLLMVLILIWPIAGFCQTHIRDRQTGDTARVIDGKLQVTDSAGGGGSTSTNMNLSTVGGTAVTAVEGVPVKIMSGGTTFPSGSTNSEGQLIVTLTNSPVTISNTVTIQGNVGITNATAPLTNAPTDLLHVISSGTNAITFDDGVELPDFANTPTVAPTESTNTVRGLAFVSDPIPLLVDGAGNAYAANDLWADIITVTNVFTYTNNSKAIITAIKLLINQDSSPAVTFIPMARAWTMGATNAANVTPSSEMNYAGVPISFTSSDIKDVGTNRIGFKTGLNIQVTSTNRNLLFMSIADDTTGMSNQTSTITVMGYIDQDPAQ